MDNVKITSKNPALNIEFGEVVINGNKEYVCIQQEDSISNYTSEGVTPTMYYYKDAYSEYYRRPDSIFWSKTYINIGTPVSYKNLKAAIVSCVLNFTIAVRSIKKGKLNIRLFKTAVKDRLIYENDWVPDRIGRVSESISAVMRAALKNGIIDSEGNILKGFSAKEMIELATSKEYNKIGTKLPYTKYTETKDKTVEVKDEVVETKTVAPNDSLLLNLVKGDCKAYITEPGVIREAHVKSIEITKENGILIYTDDDEVEFNNICLSLEEAIGKAGLR